MRSLFALLLLAACGSAPAPIEFAPVAVEATPVPFDASDAARDGAGPLRYMGGIWLKSSAGWFGGWSALRCPDRCYAIGDAGSVLRFDLVEDGGKLVGVANAEGAAQLDGNGLPGPKADRDAEALVISPGGSEALVGYEGSNSFWLVPLGHSRWQATRRFQLREMAGWEKNGGPETLVMMPSGKPLVIAEQGEGPRVPAIVIGGKPEGNIHFEYQPPANFSPTDAVVDGDRLIVLNRAYSALTGVALALVEVHIGDITEGAAIKGRELIRLKPPANIDNMEAIELRRTDDKAYLYLLSDDNFSVAQRTLLLKFELVRPGQPTP